MKWVRRPAGEDILDAYPKEALRKHVLIAQTIMQCTLTDKGLLADCKLKSENPEGLGFGRAMLSLAHLFKASGVQTGGGIVTIPMTWHATD